MFLYIILFCISLAAFLYIRRSITRDHLAQRHDLKCEHAKLVQKYERLRAEQMRLTSEVSILHQSLIRSKNAPDNSDGTFLPRKKSKKDKFKDDAISSFMLSNGIISVEQYQKATATMLTMKHDLLTTCLTLGFVDNSTAEGIRNRFASE